VCVCVWLGGQKHASDANVHWCGLESGIPRYCVDAQVANPGFPGTWSVSFKQDNNSVTLTVVRPLFHATHPISTSGTTSAIYATGPSSASNPMTKHGKVKGVSPAVVVVGLEAPFSFVPTKHSMSLTLVAGFELPGC
jgi:hypothetical protein